MPKSAVAMRRMLWGQRWQQVGKLDTTGYKKEEDALPMKIRRTIRAINEEGDGDMLGPATNSRRT